MRHLVLLAALLPAAAHAACQTDSQVFVCTIKGKVLEICHAKGALVYSFGRPDKPDLTIAAPLEAVQFTPWPGVGGAIWETVAFPNQGHVYEVWTSIDRDPEATEGLQGGVRVLQGDSTVAELTCDPGTASNSLDVIWDLKEAIGQCWDFDSRSWQAACN